MATIIENLDVLKNIKEDIKTAIENKGVDMTNTPFTGYAEKINEITIDVGEYGLKFANSTLTKIPEIFDFSNVTDYSYMFTNCKNLTGSPIGDSIVIEGSGDYAFYGAKKLNLPQVTIRGNATAFNMFGNNNDSIRQIECEGFPSNIIKGETAANVFISLGSTRNNIFGDDNDRFLYDNIVANLLYIAPQQEQDLQTLFWGIGRVEEMTIGNYNISYNFNHNRDVQVKNIKRLKLDGDYSNYGLNGYSNSYSRYFFEELEYIYGCNGLKGTFYFTNFNRDFNVESFKVFLKNIGSVPDGECEINLPTRMTGQLSEDDIATATNKGYIIRY